MRTLLNNQTMNKNNFDMNRLSHFIQRQVTMNVPPMLIAAGAVFGALLVISLLVAYFNPQEVRDLKGLYMAVFFIAGYILTSRIFSELHSPQKSYAYLTLPVSTLEKLTGSWLLSSPVYVIVFSILLFMIYLATLLMAGDYTTLADLFDKQYFYVMAIFMVTQTIFFLGACYFRKNNFFKTVLAIFLLVIIIGLYSGLLGWTLFGGEGNISSEDFPSDFRLFVENISKWTSQVFFWSLLGPFMLVVSYFSLKERQV